MALTDLLKSFTRVSALGVTLYACGDTNNYYGNGENGGSSGNFCEEYKEMCPGKKFSVSECQDYCNESSSPRDQPDSDCAFGACAVLVGTCDTYLKADPRDIIDCMREYGWDVEYN